MMRKWMKKSLLAGFLGACICGIAGCGGNKEESYRVIEIMQLEGTAVVTREEVGELEAYENMRLESGDQMRVEEESSVVLSLDDDKYVLVEPGTQMSLTAEGNSADSRTVIHLEEGAVVSQLTQKLSDESSYEVTTPNSTMAVRGTVFRVEVTYDENGESRTCVTVLEGVVGSRLIYPDGSEDSLEEERQIPMGSQVNIRSDEEISEYYPYDMTEIDFERYSVEAMDFLNLCLKRDAELCITAEEIDEWIQVISGESEPEEEEVTEEPEQITEEEEDTETEPVNTPVQTQPVTEPAAEETAVQPETPPAAEESTGGSSSGGSSSDSSNPSEEDTPGTTETFTVTFTYQGNTFYTLTVEEGSTAAAPILQPTANGHWDYDSGAAVTGNMTVVWVEE